MCVGGVGIFVFYIVIGVGIFVVDGKEICNINGCDYLLELSIIGDFVIVKVWKVDCYGNCIYCYMVMNFNLMVVIVGKIMVFEVEEIVELGELELS